MAAVFDFNGSGRFGRERNLYQGGWSTVQNKESGGGGGVKITPARSLLQNSVRPRTECLIGAVKLQLSITCQMCHSDISLSRGESGRYRALIVKLLGSIQSKVPESALAIQTQFMVSF